MQPSLNFRDTGTLIALGQRAIAHSFNVLDAERLRTNHSPKGLNTAWPAILLDMSEILEGTPSLPKFRADAKDIRLATQITDVYSQLPYSSLDKKLTLHKARAKTTWKKLSAQYGYTWAECRQISDTVTLHLVRLLNADLLMPHALRSCQ